VPMPRGGTRCVQGVWSPVWKRGEDSSQSHRKRPPVTHPTSWYSLKHFEEIQLLRRRIFGHRAERLSEEDRRQLLLFNEAEEILPAQIESCTD
jgi:hypothetical protein